MSSSLGPWFFASFVVSAIGFVLFAYGKRLARVPQLIVGLVLMVYPYFVTAPLPMVGVGVALVVGLAIAVRLGW